MIGKLIVCCSACNYLMDSEQLPRIINGSAEIKCVGSSGNVMGSIKEGLTDQHGGGKKSKKHY